MNPKEKSQELFDTFYDNNTDYIDSNKDAEESAITCAIIAVNEIIQELESLFDKGSKDVHQSIDTPKRLYRDVIKPEIDFYKEVKRELENL